jgi:Zn-dependent protease
MTPRPGYFALGSVLGVPLFVHWSLPIGPILLSGLRFAPGLYFGILAIILVHELGHAMLAKHRGCEVQAIEMHAFGGVCRSEVHTTLDGIVIAWGGVLAQAWLYIVVVALTLLWTPTTRAMTDLVYALTVSNLVVAAVNLIPIGSLDGKEAWQIFRALGAFGGLKAEDVVLPDDDGTDADVAVGTDADDVVRTVSDALAQAKRDARISRDRVE